MIKVVKWNLAWDLIWFPFTFGWFFVMRGQDDGICFVPIGNEYDDPYDDWQCYLGVECLAIAVIIHLPLILCKVYFLLNKNAMLHNFAKFKFLHKLMFVWYSFSCLTFKFMAIFYWQTSFLQLGLNTESMWSYPFWVILNIQLYLVGICSLVHFFEFIIWLCNGCGSSS